MHKRDLYKQIWRQLSADKPLIMLSGPRQSGKTTFARDIAARDFTDTVYFTGIWRLIKDASSQTPFSSPKSREVALP